MPKKPSASKTIETLTHFDEKRKNIPTAEHQAVLDEEQKKPRQIRYPRNTDLDPQLVWRGKDEQDWSDLVVHAPPLYIQEKIHPKALVDDLLRQSKAAAPVAQFDLFHDFNGIPHGAEKTDFYQHDQNWTNRMLLGDSLQVMASLAEREGLRGKVQCIYFDPPYGIKFNSNFQWSTTSRDVKDGKADHITREPEQVKAFRDTWRDGIHSYLTYLRDRLTVARDLLTESGSIFVQIGDENVHRVRAVLDEVFGDENFCSLINVAKTSGAGSPAIGTNVLASTCDFIIWYAKSIERVKYRQPYSLKTAGEGKGSEYKYVEQIDGARRPMAKDEDGDALVRAGGKLFRYDNIISQTGGATTTLPVELHGQTYVPSTGGWKTNKVGMDHLLRASRIAKRGTFLSYVRYIQDFIVTSVNNSWDDLRWGFDASEKRYVVETNPRVVQRCMLMTTDPGDLVLDPTCGSGTTATVAEQWGRRWITIDTSRVALALARARIMGARYPFYLLADSREGQQKEAEVTRTALSSQPVHGNIRHGFVYERVPHITLKSIANNAEIDVIWDKWEEQLKPLREKFSEFSLKFSGGSMPEEWELPRERPENWPLKTENLLAEFWTDRIARQQEIDKSIAAKAEFEYLYDKPYEDKKKVRVAGPFTVESLSPHRVLGVDEDDGLIDPLRMQEASPASGMRTFEHMILENLKAAGVQQAHKEDRIQFLSLGGWPGEFICAEGRYMEGDTERRAGIFIGPEFGTVTRPDLVDAAREAGDAGFDVLIACAFNYEAHAGEFHKLGRIPVLKARMNADLHMADDLKTTGKGNLFVIFGEPDIELLSDSSDRLRVKVNGVDVFDPSTGEVRSDSAEGIACWFLDTDYNGESFFVRHAYFLGQNDPYTSLKTTLKAEIDPEAWSTLHSDTSRPFDKPKTGRIAVKVINHLGDEVMKVFKV